MKLLENGQLTSNARKLLGVLRRAMIMILPQLDELLGYPPTIPPKKKGADKFERAARRAHWDG